MYIFDAFSIFVSSLPIALSHKLDHHNVDLAGLFLTKSIHACYSQITSLDAIVNDDLLKTHFTVERVLISANKVVYNDSNSIFGQLKNISFTSNGSDSSLTDDLRITCNFRHPDLLVNVAMCETVLKHMAEQWNVTYNVKRLNDISSFPAFIIRNHKELKIYEGETLICKDSLMKIGQEALFFAYDKLYLRLTQLCHIFELTCPFLDCGLNLATKNLNELGKFSRCLMKSVRTVLGETLSKGRENRDSVMTSLLQTLGLSRTETQISMENFNRISRHNFQSLKNNQLNLEQAFLEQSVNLHRVIKKEGKEISSIYDRTAIISAVVHLLDRFRYGRESNLGAASSFGNVFDTLTTSIEHLIDLALAPLQEKAVFCMGVSCIDTKSLVISKEPELSVSARLLSIESASAGRVSCQIFNQSGNTLVHGLSDRILYEKKGQWYDRETNFEITNKCLRTGSECPIEPRNVTALDLMHNRLYFYTREGSMFVQCTEELKLVTEEKNISCTLESSRVDPPFVVVTKNKNYLVSPTNVHSFFTLIREPLRALDEEEIHLRKPAEIEMPETHFNYDSFVREWEKPFRPTENIIQLWTIMIPGFLLIVVLCVACVCCKYPQSAVLFRECCVCLGTGGCRLLNACGEFLVKFNKQSENCPNPDPSAPQATEQLEKQQPLSEGVGQTPTSSNVSYQPFNPIQPSVNPFVNPSYPSVSFASPSSVQFNALKENTSKVARSVDRLGSVLKPKQPNV